MTSSEAPDVPEVALDDLATTWRTLLTASAAYRLGSPGEAALIEAHRLIEVEVRTRYGDDLWEQMLTSSEPSGGA